MPSIICKCGHRISRGEIPNPNGFRIFEDVKVEDIVAKVRNADEFEAFMSFSDYSMEMLKCSSCGLLWIDHNSDSNYTPYRKSISTPVIKTKSGSIESMLPLCYLVQY